MMIDRYICEDCTTNPKNGTSKLICSDRDVEHCWIEWLKVQAAKVKDDAVFMQNYDDEWDAIENLFND